MVNEDYVAENAASWLAHRSILTPTFSKRPKFSQPLVNSSVKLGNLNLEEEYDPRFPNEYEKVTKLLSIKHFSRTTPQKEQVKPERLDSSSTEGEKERLSGDEMLRRRLEAMEKSQMNEPEPGEKSRPVALKMMEKMGWKEGSGLGKHQQGMKTPLMAKSTGKNTAIIVKSMPKVDTVKQSKEVESEDLSLNKSRVVLIIFHQKVNVEMDELEEILSEFGTVVNTVMVNNYQLDVLAKDEGLSELKCGDLTEKSVIISEFESQEQAERLYKGLNNSTVMESNVSVLYIPLDLYNSI